MQLDRTHTGSVASHKSFDFVSFRTGCELSPFYHSAVRELAYQKQHERYMATKPGSDAAKVELKKLRAMKSV